MAPKSTNSKKESGRAKKAENEAKKKDSAAAQKEQQEAKEWESGAKSNKGKEEREAKKTAEAARKAEAARLLAEEEASIASKPKAAPKAGAKKATAPKPAGPGAIAAGGGLSKVEDAPPSNAGKSKAEPEEDTVESYSATGLDNALDLLSLVTAKSDKASVGQQAAKLEAHPERRFKAAFEAYQERELPIARKDHPGLRLQQYKDLLFKQFQKSPENPFNQTLVSYDATKDDKVAALKAEKAKVEERLRAKEP